MLGKPCFALWDNVSYRFLLGPRQSSVFICDISGVPPMVNTSVSTAMLVLFVQILSFRCCASVAWTKSKNNSTIYVNTVIFCSSSHHHNLVFLTSICDVIALEARHFESPSMNVKNVNSPSCILIYGVSAANRNSEIDEKYVYQEHSNQFKLFNKSISDI